MGFSIFRTGGGVAPAAETAGVCGLEPASGGGAAPGCPGATPGGAALLAPGGLGGGWLPGCAAAPPASFPAAGHVWLASAQDDVGCTQAGNTPRVLRPTAGRPGVSHTQGLIHCKQQSHVNADALSTHS